MKSRRGFTLLEMATVMTMAGLLLWLGMLTLQGALKTERAAAAAHDRLLAVSGLADQFRADVAGAIAAPERWENHKAGPTCLVLETAKHEPIVYRYEKGRLKRSMRAHNGRTFEQEWDRPAWADVSFVRAGDKGSLITLELRPKKVAAHDADRLLSVCAALGGDLR